MGVIAALTVIGTAALMVGQAATAARRAASVADLAALAGAVAFRDSGSVVSACAAAGRTAARNDGTLVTCSVGSDASVSVQCAVPTRLDGPGLPASVERAARAGPAAPP